MDRGFVGEGLDGVLIITRNGILCDVCCSMLAMLCLALRGEDGVRFPLRALVWACWCVCVWLRCPVSVSLLYDGRRERQKEREVPLIVPTGTERI